MFHKAATLACLLLFAAIAYAAPRATNGFECEYLRKECPLNTYSATVTDPSCPDGTTLDPENGVCYTACSDLNTASIKYKNYRADMSKCVPSCMTGYRGMKTDDSGVTCVKCETGLFPQMIRGKWRCTKKGISPRSASVRTRKLADRGYEEAVCDDGTPPDADGNCHDCPSDIDPDYSGLYSVQQTRQGPVCVPEPCCMSSDEYDEAYGEYEEYADYEEDYEEEEDEDDDEDSIQNMPWSWKYVFNTKFGNSQVQGGATGGWKPPHHGRGLLDDDMESDDEFPEMEDENEMEDETEMEDEADDAGEAGEAGSKGGKKKGHAKQQEKGVGLFKAGKSKGKGKGQGKGKGKGQGKGKGRGRGQGKAKGRKWLLF